MKPGDPIVLISMDASLALGIPIFSVGELRGPRDEPSVWVPTAFFAHPRLSSGSLSHSLVLPHQVVGPNTPDITWVRTTPEPSWSGIGLGMPITLSYNGVWVVTLGPQVHLFK